MSVDISVFLEFEDESGWTLIDVDPICSAKRNHILFDALSQLSQLSLPLDTSKGSMYWFQKGAFEGCRRGTLQEKGTR